MISLKIFAAFVVLAWGARAVGDAVRVFVDPAPTPDASRAAVEAWLRQVMGDDAPPIAPKIVAVESEPIGRALAGDRFYSVRFMRYPRAFKPPRPLRMENLVRVRSGKVVPIPQPGGSQKGPRRRLQGIDASKVQDASLATLRLTEEFFQDGHYAYGRPRVPGRGDPEGRGRDGFLPGASDQGGPGGDHGDPANRPFGQGDGRGRRGQRSGHPPRLAAPLKPRHRRMPRPRGLRYGNGEVHPSRVHRFDGSPTRGPRPEARRTPSSPSPEPTLADPTPTPKPPTEVELRGLDAVAFLMDRAVTIPGTGIKFGLDALLGLLPVGGDGMTGLVRSAW